MLSRNSCAGTLAESGARINEKLGAVTAPAANECLEAKVDVAKGTVLSCAMTPCEIN
jgi:hypothetical protein